MIFYDICAEKTSRSLSAVTAESITFCLLAGVCIGTAYINGGGGTFTVLVVGTVVCLAVDVDGFTSTSGVCAV